MRKYRVEVAQEERTIWVEVEALSESEAEDLAETEAEDCDWDEASNVYYSVQVEEVFHDPRQSAVRELEAAIHAGRVPSRGAWTVEIGGAS